MTFSFLHRATISLAITLAAVAFFAPSAAFAQTPAAKEALTANPVFQKNCAKCHGENAEGRHFRGPSLISGKVAGASADDLSNIIQNGKGHMPKFANKLTAEEIDALVGQIKSANKK